MPPKIKDRYVGNTTGAFYVESKCINCDQCGMAAPKHFKKDLKEDHYYVKKQPTTLEEVMKCIEALNGCPVEAIGSNGDSPGRIWDARDVEFTTLVTAKVE